MSVDVLVLLTVALWRMLILLPAALSAVEGK